MFKNFFRRTATLVMPKVDENCDIEPVFERARRAARGEWVGVQLDGRGRHVVVVTPQRGFLFLPCPEEGTMSTEDVQEMEELISSEVKHDIAVIASTEFGGATDIWAVNQHIPFFGILIGIAYIGHSVWVFEGHHSALAAGCRDADALIVDGAMIPLLRRDWQNIVSSVMRSASICVHDRATYSLQVLR